MAKRKNDYSEPAFPVQQFVGLNNKAEPRAMRPGELVQADNIDIDDRLKIRRRRGFASAKAVAGIHGAWSTPDEDRAFVCAGGTLFEIVGDDLDLIELATGLGSGEVYFAWDGVTIYANGSGGSVVVQGRTAKQLAIPTPNRPVVSALPGELPAGRYLVTAIFEDADGRQGGAANLAEISLSDRGAIQIAAWDGAGYTVRFAVSQPNGTVCRFIQQTGSVVVCEHLAQLGAPIEEVQYAAYPPPAGGPIAWHQGKLYGCQYKSDDKISEIYFSKPFWPHLTHRHLDSFYVPGEVVFLVSIENAGLLIGTNKAIWIITLEDQLDMVAEVACVPGPQSWYRDEDDTVFFWTEEGMCSAMPFNRITDTVLAPAPGARCAVGFIEDGGFERLMACTEVTADDETPNSR